MSDKMRQISLHFAANCDPFIRLGGSQALILPLSPKSVEKDAGRHKGTRNGGAYLPAYSYYIQHWKAIRNGTEWC